MRGITKALARTPHLVTSRVGMANKSQDAEFNTLNGKFAIVEQSSEKLLKDAVVFRESVKNMLMSGANFGVSFASLFQPIGAEDIERNHPAAANTMLNVSQYQTIMEELRETLTPEIELVESRIVGPIKDFINIVKTIRKNITKRDHKLLDFDRHSNSFNKLKSKSEKTLKDEQNLFKVEQDYEAAAADYEYYNNALKTDLPLFFDMAARFITPLYESFYYVQLNVQYLTAEALRNFAEGKYDISIHAPPVENTYADQLGDTLERLEALSIRKPAMASARVLGTASRQSSILTTASGGAAGGGLAANAPSRTGSLYNRTAAPPPAAASASTTSPRSVAAPPAYTPSATAGSSLASAGSKRAPPPPPTKPKPGAAAEKPKDYVIALYDYVAAASTDISFSAGDQIEIVNRTESTQDWWTGRINGQEGLFPA
ncbi:BAR adaptor protein Hob1 [Tilletia horrida]|uniref:BAR adaptor protein Hob1 n=1 Tax=Tilletia horrida TaxID=155126 RepID=A0AAN6GY43_9BASI|nr:BAR adaptor protein Hob1 [Tilletia horrida]